MRDTRLHGSLPLAAGLASTVALALLITFPMAAGHGGHSGGGHSGVGHGGVGHGAAGHGSGSRGGHVGSGHSYGSGTLSGHTYVSIGPRPSGHWIGVGHGWNAHRNHCHRSGFFSSLGWGGPWWGASTYLYYGDGYARDDWDDGWLEEGQGPQVWIEAGRDERDGRADDPSSPREPDSGRSRLRFKVSPDDAVVYIDDEFAGVGERLAASAGGYITDPGPHSLTVIRPGYQTETLDVEATEDAAVDVVVDLRR